MLNRIDKKIRMGRFFSINEFVSSSSPKPKTMLVNKISPNRTPIIRVSNSIIKALNSVSGMKLYLRKIELHEEINFPFPISYGWLSLAKEKVDG